MTLPYSQFPLDRVEIIALAYREVTHAYGPALGHMTVSKVLLLMGSSMLGSLIQLPGVGGGSQLATISALQTRPGTVSIHQTTAPNPSAAVYVGAQGRYIRVQIPGTNNLSLAEVQVATIGDPLPQ